jgi:hypothetical protein
MQPLPVLVVLAAPLLNTLPPFGRTVRQALGMDAELYTLAQTATNGLTVALLIMLLAASSEAVGQSVVLLLNRVRPLRFLLAVTLSVVSNVVGYLLWSLVIWLSVRLIFGVDIPFVAALIVVGLAYAPQLLAFFEMTPYFGNFFALVLTLWTMAAIVVAIRFGMGLALWQAAITGLVSWLAIQLWRRSLGRPIYALGRWVTRGAAGTALAWSVDDVVEGRLHREQYSTNWKEWRRQWAAQRQANRSARQAGLTTPAAVSEAEAGAAEMPASGAEPAARPADATSAGAGDVERPA